MLATSKTLSTLLISSCLLAAPLFAHADSNKVSEKKITKLSKKKTNAIKIVETRNIVAEDDVDNLDIEAAIKLSAQFEFKCELGNSVVLYPQQNSEDILNMRWKNRLYKLKRVSTTTGAHRYENEKAGLVWINIPSKGLLLDSLHGRQLANECKSEKNAFTS